MHRDHCYKKDGWIIYWFYWFYGDLELFFVEIEKSHITTKDVARLQGIILCAGHSFKKIW